MHKIRRQILEIELPREAGAADAARRAARIVQEKALPKLEALFDRLGPSGRFVRLEKVEIDLGDLGEANWETDFAEKCAEQIARQVERQIFELDSSGVSESKTESADERATATFLYFLKHGVLPWAARGESLTLLETAVLKAVLADAAFFSTRLVGLFRSEKRALKRLVWQFSGGFSKVVLEGAFGQNFGKDGFEKWSKKAAELSEIAFFDSIFDQKEAKSQADGKGKKPAASDFENPFSTKKEAATAAETTSFLKPKPFDETADEPTIFEKKAAFEKSDDRKKRAFLEAVSDGFLIENAGLVLVAPFLAALFSKLELTENRIFKSENAQKRAVYALHFLATGAEKQAEEPLLVLPKILCGWPLEEPIEAEMCFSEFEKTEIDGLLRAVIAHWGVLKGTSPDGLRNSFLKRNGLLEWQKSRDAWLLRPEKMGQDVLLERLPWGFSIIKMEWMTAMVTTEWG